MLPSLTTTVYKEETQDYIVESPSNELVYKDYIPNFLGL